METPVYFSATSKGSLSKLFKGNKVYKFNHFGYEDIAEALVSELESCIQDFGFIDYHLDMVDGRPCCYSYNFRDGYKEERTFYSLLKQYPYFIERKMKYGGEDYLKLVEECMYNITGLDVHEYLGRCIRLDSITLNEDRHLNNLTVWKDIRHGYSIMPIFDNGLSLLSCIDVYPMLLPIKSLVIMVKSRPFLPSFKSQVTLFRDTKPLKIDINHFLNTLKTNESSLKSFLGDRFKYYERARDVLNLQLKVQEGVTWIRV